MFRDVCRLCSKKNNLIWLFNEQMGDNLPEIIEITSGVRIQKTDSVSQMVCSRCCELALKMYNFRTRSVKNDEDLKAQCAGYTIQKLTNSAASLPPLVPITKNNPMDDLINTPLPFTESDKINSKPREGMHLSVKKLYKNYPNVKLPHELSKSNVSPYVSLDSSEVDEWFRKRGISDTEIARLKKESLETKEERKNTLFSPRSLANLVDNVSNKIINKIGDVRIMLKPSETKNDINCNESLPSSDKLEEARRKRRKSCSSDEENRDKLNSERKRKHTHLRLIHSDSEDKQRKMDNMCSKTKSSTCESPTKLQSDDSSSSDESDEEKSFSTRALVISSNTIYMCEICDKNQASLEDLKTHMRDAHGLANQLQTPNDERLLSSDEENTDKPAIESQTPSSEKPSDTRILSNDEESIDDDYVHRRYKSSRRPRVIASDSEDDNPSTSSYKTQKECPFCHEIFTTVALRNDHVNSSCVINDSPVKLKEARLHLVRVDEIEEIRKKYSSAFEEEKEFSDYSAEHLPPPPIIESDGSLLSKALTSVKILDGVIDISDDEGEDNPKSKKLRIVHNELLNESFTSDFDENFALLKYVSEKMQEIAPTNDEIIINEQYPKERTFRNLRQYLQRYNIPIEVSHGQSLSVQYKSTTKPPERKSINTWATMPPIYLKPFVRQQIHPPRGVVAPQPRITENQGFHRLPQQISMFNNRRSSPATTFIPITNQVTTTQIHQETTMISTQQTSATFTAVQHQLPHQVAITNNCIMPQQAQYQVTGLRQLPSYSQHMNNTVSCQSSAPITPVVLSSTHNLGSQTYKPNIISCYTFVMPHTVQTISNNQEPVATTTIPTVPVTTPIRKPLIRVRDLKDLS